VSLSLAELECVVEEVRREVKGGRLENVYPAGREALALVFRVARERRCVVVSARPGFARLHLASQRPPSKGELPHFVRAARSGLRGRVLQAIEVVGCDRVVALRFARGGEGVGGLVAELTGRTSNVYLLGAEDAIVAALRRPGKDERDLRPGATYRPPRPVGPSPAAARRDRFSGSPSYSEAIERHYGEAEAAADLGAFRRAVASGLKARRRRLARLVDKLSADLRSTEGADNLRVKGELLKIHLHAVPPRAEKVAVENVFDQGRGEVEIELSPRLSPHENMERYFRRYKKLQAARERVEKRLAEARSQLDQLDRELHEVEAAEDLAELEALAARVGYRSRRGTARRRAGPLRFTSADGYEILVARTADENDQLTFRIARGGDLWLHVEGYSGSHVVVRLPAGKSCPKETLLDAATLAVQYSELRRSGSGPVVYCYRKHVRKARGGRPGEVLYARSRSLRVRVEGSRLKRLMGKEGP